MASGGEPPSAKTLTSVWKTSVAVTRRPSASTSPAPSSAGVLTASTPHGTAAAWTSTSAPTADTRRTAAAATRATTGPAATSAAVRLARASPSKATRSAAPASRASPWFPHGHVTRRTSAKMRTSARGGFRRAAARRRAPTRPAATSANAKGDTPETAPTAEGESEVFLLIMGGKVSGLLRGNCSHRWESFHRGRPVEKSPSSHSHQQRRVQHARRATVAFCLPLWRAMVSHRKTSTTGWMTMLVATCCLSLSRQINERGRERDRGRGRPTLSTARQGHVTAIYSLCSVTMWM
mmetsp:Transcript_21857/g.53575  ORF Transcript_21857/g.53575 Transcript_21857/m.53575 type:complete len:293 (+) Transcript_21857:2865-3743(+)